MKPTKIGILDIGIADIMSSFWFLVDELLDYREIFCDLNLEGWKPPQLGH